MGSGTTGVAAILEGRFFIGIEKEKKYMDVAIERTKKAEEDFTNQQQVGIIEEKRKETKNDSKRTHSEVEGLRRRKGS